MSAKSSRKPAPRKPTPRALVDIQKEYQEAAFNAGQEQYQIYVHEKQLKDLNNRLYELNLEAGERNRLDSETKAAQTVEAAPQEVPNV